MGTWIKETDTAIYLMEGGYWISRVTKYPSETNPTEQILKIKGMRSWFTRSDFPRAMTVAIGTGEPEPEPKPTATVQTAGSGATGSASMLVRVISATYFKLEPKMSTQLSDADKVLVEKGEEFAIQYYTETKDNHWKLELLEPTIGDTKTKTWYAFKPDIELITNVILKVTSDTLFKREPKMSSELPDSQKEFVRNGSEFKLISFLPAANNHAKVDLADASLGSDDASTWYAYKPDIKIEGQRQTLKVVSDTFFKAQPKQSSQLGKDEKVFIKSGTVFLINSYANPERNHVRVALQGAFLGAHGRNTWYAYVPDIMMSGTEIGNAPNDSNSSSKQPASIKDRGIALSFPGFDGVYYSNNPIYWKTQYSEQGNFTWGEALHAEPNGRYRRPASQEVVYGILRVAKVMEEIRRRYGGKPIQINSWYRDPITNAAVGGASQSRHMAGDAVDFVVPGVSNFQVYADLDGWWGSRGGLASSSVFTHIDTRGYRARWDYGY